MDNFTKNFDWNKARAFLATAENGSLSSAATSLSLTQPTLSRQVSGLEYELGVTLFERIGKTLVLTQSGIDLLEHVKIMGEGANKLSLAASGHSEIIDGHVTITTTDIVAMYLLPKAISKLREVAPNIKLEVIASNEIQDLRKREADISLRHVRPNHPNLIAKKIRDMSAHLYGSTEYLNTLGHPLTEVKLNKADYIGYENSPRQLEYYNAFGLNLQEENLKINSDAGFTVMEYVRKGMGIAGLMCEIADTIDNLERILHDAPSIKAPLWLVTHRELHTSRRIRLVFDLLAQQLTAPYTLNDL